MQPEDRRGRLDVVPRYELLHLNESQREELTKWAHSRTLPAGDVFRAKLILWLADGMTYEQVVSSLAQPSLLLRGGKPVSSRRALPA